jgi:beta-lactamase superfamily II metal-dependent hydrolase
MIDICCGNIDESEERSFNASVRNLGQSAKPSGNYRMCDQPTNPISYMKQYGIDNPFRFILTHPDCDHMDGFNALCTEFALSNFWDNGLRRKKPDFEGSPYEEEDWDTYERVRDKKTETEVVYPLAGSKFQFANDGDPKGRGDCLSAYP